MTTVTVPTSVVPAAPPSTPGTSRRDPSASAADVTGSDRFDRHLERAVRDGRAAGTDRRDPTRPSDDDAPAATEGGRLSETGRRADAASSDDEARAEGDAPIVVTPAAVALASRSEVTEPIAVDRVATAEGATTEPTTSGYAITGAVASVAATDITTAAVESPSGGDTTGSPATDPVAAPVDVHALGIETAVAAPPATAVAREIAATTDPTDPTAPTDLADPTGSTDRTVTAGSTDGAPVLDGVAIVIDTPVSSAAISTAGRAALHARAAAGEATGDPVMPVNTATTPGATAAEPAATDGAAAGGDAPTAPITSPSGVPVHSAPRRTTFATAASEAAVTALVPTTALPEKPALRGSLSLPSISVDLSDEGLGPMQLQARQGADGLHLTITAADREVGAALARAGSELRRDLEAAGTLVGSLDIGHGGADGSSGRRQGAAGDASSRQAGRVSTLGATAALSSSAGRTAPTTAARTGRADAGLDLLI